MEIFVLIWVICGVCSGVVASGKGRSGAAWFLFGLLLGPFGLLVAFVSSDESTNQRSQVAPSSSGESASPDKVEASKKDGLEKGDRIEKLESLANLREQGALTEEEFQREKQKVMNRDDSSEERSWKCKCGHVNPHATATCLECKRARDAVT